MRRVLDALYDVSAGIAALLMIAILVSILIQVLGGIFGFYIRGTDAYAGYAMAGVSFLALAHTLRRREHIRVTLFLDRLDERWRRRFDLGCLLVATVLSGLFAWYSWKMVWWSWSFNDMSMAEDRTPMWIPQIMMAFGVSVLFVAFLDDTVRVLRGGTLGGPPGELSHSE
jgi:TRAP-type C4-dicarboxylate transport system permease small subunit